MMKKVLKMARSASKAGLLVMSIALLVSVSMVKAAPFGELQSFWDDRENDSTMTVDHSVWQSILDEYLDDETEDGVNRFNYDGITEEGRNQLSSYLEYLQSVEPRQLNSNEQMAYWINLYNAATVFVVLDQGDGLTSIREIRSGIFTPGPWKLKLLKVVYQDLSLDDIEHGILRPIWRDKRIHYAVNCASIGCPNLLKTAFTKDNLEELLEQAAKDYINHPRGVNIEDEELILSSIFDWYAEDFGDGFSDLLQHLLDYSEPEQASQIKDFTDADYDYDWDFNGVN